MVIQILARTPVPWSKFIEFLEEDLEGIIRIGEDDGEVSTKMEDATTSATPLEPISPIGSVEMEDTTIDATPQELALHFGSIEMEDVTTDATP